MSLPFHANTLQGNGLIVGQTSNPDICIGGFHKHQHLFMSWDGSVGKEISYRPDEIEFEKYYLLGYNVV
jgi:hypothetical protein